MTKLKANKILAKVEVSRRAGDQAALRRRIDACRTMSELALLGKRERFFVRVPPRPCRV